MHARDMEHSRAESVGSICIDIIAVKRISVLTLSLLKDPQAIEVHKSLEKVQRHLSKQQSNLKALRTQIAEVNGQPP